LLGANGKDSKALRREGAGDDVGVGNVDNASQHQRSLAGFAMPPRGLIAPLLLCGICGSLERNIFAANELIGCLAASRSIRFSICGRCQRQRLFAWGDSLSQVLVIALPLRVSLKQRGHHRFMFR
jgi:hypothetical protein